MKKFENKSNAFGNLIEKYRIKNGLSRSDLSTKLDLIGVPISGDEIYRIEKQKMILKDFELIAICSVLNINPNNLIKEFNEKIK